MVSGTRCPACSDQVKLWRGSRAAAPKGQCPVEHRGEFPNVHPSVHPSVLPSVPPPIGHQGLKFALPAPNSALQTSNRPSRLQFSPPGLKSALQTSNLPSRPSISPPSTESALRGSNLPSEPQICSPSLDSALQPSNMPPSRASGTADHMRSLDD